MTRVQVQIWMSEAERDELKARAGQVGISVGEYMRRLAFDHERPRTPDLLGRLEDHERLIAELEGGRGVKGTPGPTPQQRAKVEDPPPEPSPLEPQFEPKPPPKIASRELPNWKRATDLRA